MEEIKVVERYYYTQRQLKNGTVTLFVHPNTSHLFENVTTPARLFSPE